jgi:hypothetical protein
LKNTFARSLIAAMTLFVAAVAFADPARQLSAQLSPATPLSGAQLLGEQRVDVGTSELDRWGAASPEPATGVASGLAFDLPAEAVTPSAAVKVAVSNGTRVYIEETIVLPSGLEVPPTISFLANHPRQLALIRKVAASRPDAIRFTVTVGGNPIVDVPFVVADSGSDRLANGGSIAGSSESVLVRLLRDPSKVRMTPCEDACEYDFVECWMRCDENGPGCPWCAQYYSECIWYCNN